MKPFVFIGPTLKIEQALSHLDAVYLPPVKYGDVYRITELYSPPSICIIDGYFNQVPAVWHKEILWAIDQGVTVYGASSMGALRAAELEPMGMIGHGQIFEAYKRGILLPYVDDVFEDDDEVAVIHAPPEMAYRCLSEAMVNIRITLANAHQHQIIDQPARNKLVNIAKSLFYPQRHYQNIVDGAEKRVLSTSLAEHLLTWIEQNSVDQKKLDAISVLQLIDRQHRSQDEVQHPNPQAFVHTSQWQSAINEIEQNHRIDHHALNELRLLGPDYFKLLDRALIDTNDWLGNDKSIAVEQLNDMHQSPDKLDESLTNRWIHVGQRTRLSLYTQNECDLILLRHLETNNELEAFEKRATDKLNKLNSKKIPYAHELSELDLLQLADWYFANHLNLELPTQIETYVASLGIDAMNSFYDMILQEYYYQEELKNN